MSTRQQKEMCCLRIGHAEYLIPIDNGLKIIQLMRGSIECEIDYRSHPLKYRCTRATEVELRSVSADQIILLPDTPAVAPRTSVKRLPAP